ncbi:Transcription factor ORG2 [Acorus calamus]|uniref:Protein IRON-RELATED TRANSCRIPTION FACTOR 2 n=1 Tax=Acorus calamus TaxID=4465 RepID=A0AAV9F2K9_ACOCL|nr:Transcription factor ORG2 [Acorus calamus]
MVAFFSTPMFSTFDDHKIRELPFNNHGFQETEASNLFLGFPAQEADEINYHPTSKRKLTHNAYERDRRKKLNSLYSSLRSLLPGINNSEKLSIPNTISHVLQYIPELQRQIDDMRHTKEEMLARISRRGDLTRLESSRRRDGEIYPAVTASPVNEREFMVQVCVVGASGGAPLSSVLRDLEVEGFWLLNASTFVDEVNKAKENVKIGAEILQENLINIVALRS